LSPTTRVLVALLWFGALALAYGLVLGPEEASNAALAENLVLAGFVVASVIGGALLRMPALAGPPAGFALLIALDAVGAELPVFVSSALWGVGAFLMGGLELLGAGVGIVARYLLFGRSGARDDDSDRAYNPAP
jgi:hypothetical protein